MTDTGKQSIVEHVEGVQINRGPQLAITSKNNMLEVGYTFSQSYSMNAERAVLFNAIYDSL